MERTTRDKGPIKVPLHSFLFNRYFADETCQHFQTFETDKEYQARNRAATRRVTKSTSNLPIAVNNASEPTLEPLFVRPEVPEPPDLQTPHETQAPFTKGGKRPKTFNISTPKAHFFPDYPDQIEIHGTTDSLSTKLVGIFCCSYFIGLIYFNQGESRHSHLKSQNNHTNYNNATPQIIGIDVRQAVHAQMTHELSELERMTERSLVVEPQEANPEVTHGYRIAAEERPSNRENLPEFLHQHQGDAAVIVRVHSFLFILLSTKLVELYPSSKSSSPCTEAWHYFSR